MTKYLVYSISVIFLVTGISLVEPSLNETKLGLIANITGFFDFIKGGKALRTRIQELEKENENLRMQIFKDSIIEPRAIKVYSTYPLNNSRTIAIAAGETDGIKEGDIITYGKNILIGKVEKVFKKYSIVNTIFDPAWKMEVRVGVNEVDGLFTGGNRMTISLVSNKAQISKDDIVFTSGFGFPYGIEVGRVKKIEEKTTAPLKEAILEPVIQLEDLRNVSVYR